MIDVLSLCDVSRNFLKPWEENGFNCLSVDLFDGGNGPCIVGDVRELEKSLPLAKIVVAWPPCTHLASSGARHWKAKGEKAYIDAISIVDCCTRVIKNNASIGGFIENPRGRLSGHLGSSDFTFHPWHYSGWNESDNYTKETHLWLYGLVKVPQRKVSDNCVLDYNRILGSKKGRDVTPMGFSRAFFHANLSLFK